MQQQFWFQYDGTSAQFDIDDLVLLVVILAGMNPFLDPLDLTPLYSFCEVDETSGLRNPCNFCKTNCIAEGSAKTLKTSEMFYCNWQLPMRTCHLVH